MRRTGKAALGLALGLAVLPMAGPLAPLPLQAETAVPAPVTALSQALNMPEVVTILREEGLRNGADLAADLPGGPEDPSWTQVLDRTYDAGRMLAAFDAAFARALAGQETAAAEALAFFGSPAGQRIMGLETGARRALLEEGVEDSAAEAFAALSEKNPARVAAIERFVALNDLIESNVMGSLNSNLAFFRGMAASGAPGLEMSESEMLAEVWAGEGAARQETIDWVYPFLAMAYQPLSDAELDAYIAFSGTPAGRVVNAAMFKAFDEVFDAITFDLGRAMGLRMTGQDI